MYNVCTLFTRMKHPCYIAQELLCLSCEDFQWVMWNWLKHTCKYRVNWCTKRGNFLREAMPSMVDAFWNWIMLHSQISAMDFLRIFCSLTNRMYDSPLWRRMVEFSTKIFFLFFFLLERELLTFRYIKTVKGYKKKKFQQKWIFSREIFSKPLIVQRKNNTAKRFSLPL